MLRKRAFKDLRANLSAEDFWSLVDALQHAILSIIQDELAKNSAFRRGKTTRNLNKVVAALHCSSLMRQLF